MIASSLSVRRRFAIFSYVLFAVSAVCLAITHGAQPLKVSPQWVLLLAVALVSENFAVALPGYSLSIVYPLTIAAAITCGPAAAAVVAGATAVNLHEVKARLPGEIMLFNFGQLVLATLACSWVYLAMGGGLLLSDEGLAVPLSSSDFPRALLPLTGMIVMGAIANVALTAAGYAVKNEARILDVLVGVGWVPQAQVALGVLGVLMAQVMAVQVLALPLLALPLLIARQLYQSYTALRSAYADTVRSLVGILEAKDPYTRGHSERVADYAVRTSRAMGLGPREVEIVEYAALLHDLGKLALPGGLLNKESRLSPEEWLAIRRHPDAGADMIERIPPLRHLASLIRSHHERVDGTGYPLGLREGQLSDLSKILAVADAFDAMTTTRAYRPAMSVLEAVNELRGSAGTQFDPAVVGFLVDSLMQPPVDARSDDAPSAVSIAHEVSQ